MPRCLYCGDSPYATYCASFYRHVENCRTVAEHKAKAHELQTKLNRLRAKEHKPRPPTLPPALPPVVNNYYVTNLVMGNQNMYVDYPKSETTQRVLSHAHSFDIQKVKSIDDLNKILDEIQDMNNKEIDGYLNGTDINAASNALSFLADVVRVIRTRLQKESPKLVSLIEAAEDFERGCLTDKQRLLGGPTVEEV